jgi:hypothetical protein
MKQSFLQKLKIVYVLIFLTLISGCISSSGNFAKLEDSDQVGQTFESYTVSPEYKYYYWGSKFRPRAVIGISNTFHLKSDLWNPIELTSEYLRNWIWGQSKRKLGTILKPYGKNITGPQGQHFGVWYSLESWQQWARIEIISDSIITIGAPIDRNRKKGRHGMDD